MDEPTSEIWQAVPGYEGLYEGSSLGQAKSLPRNTTRGGILKAPRGPDGYRRVTLYKDGRGRSLSLHEVVALTFLGPRPDGMDIRHLDGDRQNNALVNLAYGTRSDNVQDMLGHGRGNIAKTRCPQDHPYDEANTYVRPDGGRECQICRQNRRDAYDRGERGRKPRALKPAPVERTLEPDLAGEEWRPIPGFAHYQASSAGRVRSLSHMTGRGIRRGRILKPATQPGGYLSVQLSRGGVADRRYMHRLVAEAFYGPCPDGLEVRHLDGDPANNSAENLAYGTRSEQSFDRLRHGTHPIGSRKACGQGHLWTEATTIIRYWPDGRFKQRVCTICLEGWVATTRQRRKAS